jgi:hypothetical protein
MVSAVLARPCEWIIQRIPFSSLLACGRADHEHLES